jgi:hypothetical protein
VLGHNVAQVAGSDGSLRVAGGGPALTGRTPPGQKLAKQPHAK